MGNSSAKLPYTPSSKKLTNFAHRSDIWQIYEGTDGATLIFRHEKKGARPLDTACAQNALKRLRTMRHPYILKLLVRNEFVILLNTPHDVFTYPTPPSLFSLFFFVGRRRQ